MGHLNTYLNFRIFELCLGIVCFGLFAKYFIIHKSADSAYKNIVMDGIGFVAADGFPFLVQIPFLIAYWRYKKNFQYNILNPIVNLVGVVVYITSGSMCLRVSYYRQQLAVGSMFIITGCVYFLDLSYWLTYLRKAEKNMHGQYGASSANQNQSHNTHPQAPPNVTPMVQINMADPNRQYGSQMTQPYMADPNRQYGSPMSQPYMSDPNRQYGSPMTQQYMPDPNRQYGSPMAQPYIVDPNSQYGSPMAQPYMADPNRQSGGPMVQPNVAYPNR